MWSCDWSRLVPELGPGVATRPDPDISLATYTYLWLVVQRWTLRRRSQYLPKTREVCSHRLSNDEVASRPVAKPRNLPKMALKLDSTGVEC